MLCSTFLVLWIHLRPWSLNEGWQIYKIVEPAISTGIGTGSLDKNYFQFEYIKYKIKFIIWIMIPKQGLTNL